MNIKKKAVVFIFAGLWFSLPVFAAFEQDLDFMQELVSRAAQPGCKLGNLCTYLDFFMHRHVDVRKKVCAFNEGEHAVAAFFDTHLFRFTLQQLQTIAEQAVDDQHELLGLAGNVRAVVALLRWQDLDSSSDVLYNAALDWELSMLALIFSIGEVDEQLDFDEDIDSTEQGGLLASQAPTTIKAAAKVLRQSCLQYFESDKNVLTPVLANPAAPTDKELKNLWEVSVTYFFWWDTVLTNKKKAAAAAGLQLDAQLAQAKKKLDVIMLNVRTINSSLKDLSAAMSNKKTLLTDMQACVSSLNKVAEKTKKKMASSS
jgi:hypothetical protein